MTATTAPVVLVDMDSVIFDWEKHFHRRFTDLHPTLPMLHPTERREFNMMLPEHAEYHDKILAVMDEPGFYAELEMIDGADVALNSMVELGLTVMICTSPWLTNPTCVQDKLDSLERHIGAGWAERAIITKDKTLVHGDVLIDDKPDIKGARTPTWQQVYFTQPYNAHRDGLRMDSWTDWRSALSGMLGGYPLDAAA